MDGARRLPEKACVHCHQVYDFRRAELQRAGRWSIDRVWVYPQPENIGVTLDVDYGNRVSRVAAGSAADRAGLRPGDLVQRVGDVATVSFADVQYGLHVAPGAGRVEIAWERDGRMNKAMLELADGWRKTDVSWRWSLRGLDPQPWVRGDDLTAEEKRALGLDVKRLAFRQGAFVTPVAEAAGIRNGDIIVGVDGKALEMTARQFTAHIRLTYRVGDRVTYNVIRDGKLLNVPLTLQGR
jgi:S1-C subfamily serine protease